MFDADLTTRPCPRTGATLLRTEYENVWRLLNPAGIRGAPFDSQETRDDEVGAGMEIAAPPRTKSGCQAFRVRRVPFSI